jgi:hypothetical protein
MSHIWIVLYIAGKLVAAWGPIQYFDTTDQCINAMSQYNNMVARGDDVKLSCISSIIAPPLNINGPK